MPLYLGTDEAGTTGASLQEFAPTFGQKMSAATREAWLESYGPAATDFVRSRMADDKRKITAAEAEAMRLSQGGGVRMVLKPKDDEYTAGQWLTILERQRELAAVKDVRERTPWEAGSVLRGAAMFGAGIVDPVNLATAFVPWTRSIGAMRGVVETASVGATFGARTGARAAVGAVDGGLSTLALEPVNYAIRQAIGDDYDAVDAMANIAFGAAFGGGIHVVGGSALDGWKAWKARERPGMITPDPTRDVAETPQGGVVGAETRVRVGDAYEPARWVLVEADSLQATVEKADNQFRDRSRPAYQAEIQQRANNLDPALVLADSPVMDIGAPTLAADGRIVGGNGRALFITRAYEIGKGGDYRAALEQRLADIGIDTDVLRNMSRPVLVRQFARQVDVKRAAMLSNEGGATVMSPLEQSKVDAERLGNSRLRAGADGSLDVAENRAAIRKWVEAMPENQRNAIMDSDGKLSPEGQRRLSNAMLFQAYGDSPVLSRLVEALDPGSRNLATAIGRTAPVLAGMRAEIAAGNLHPLDLAADLQHAVEKFNQLREQGVRVADHMAQTNAFSDGMTPESRMLLEFIGRNIHSPLRLMDAITGFAERLSAEGNPKQTDMFGDVRSPDKNALLRDAIMQAESSPETAAEIVASVQPETREAALRAAVAQSVDGRAVEVDAIVGMDPGRNTATIDDVAAAMDRNVSPDEQPLADVEAARAVEERNAAAPKWQALEAADQAQAEADATLDEVVKAGDQAFKYSRGEAPRQTTEELTDAIRTAFGRDSDALMQSGQVQIVASPKDIPGGPHPADVKAATAPDGTVYVVAENVSPAEARGILLHEVGVHVGMERMLGREVFDSVLSELDDAIGRGEEWAEAARAAVPADTPAGLVREEQLAYLVQNAPELPIVQRIIAAVRAWAYRTFEFARERMTLTEADFRAMAVSALQHAAHGGRFGEMAPAFSRDVAQTEAKAFRDWFGESKVVGPDGKPLVVYHGGLRWNKADMDAGGRGALWATDDYATAAGYADQFGAAEAEIKPLFLKIENPLDLRDPAVREAIWPDDWIRENNIRQDRELVEQAMAYAKANGFDGMIHPDSDVMNRGGHTSYVIFSDTQAKLAQPTERMQEGNFYGIGNRTDGNRGTFDPTNPDIRYSRGETPEPPKPADELKPFDDAVKRAKAYASVLRAAADKLDDDAQAAAAMRAAMPDISPAEIEDLLAQLRRQVSGLRGMARSARDAITAEDRAAGMQSDALRAADTLSNNLQMAAVIERRNAALNMAARLRASTFLQQFNKPGLDFEGFRALIVGTQRKRVSGRLSVDGEGKAFRGEWLGGMISDMERAGIWREFTSGEFDRDVFVALHAMGRGEQPQVSPTALKIAEVVNKYQEDARNTRNRFGAWIRDLSGYITRQTHDMFKIRDAGMKEWSEYVLPRLDLQKTMRDFDGSVDEFLARVYDDFAAGQHMKTPAGEDDMAAFGRGANLARRESASRVLYFKDGAAAYEYNVKFGQGRLSDTVLQGLESSARSAALLKAFGTNPEAAVDRLFREYADNLRGDPVRRAAFMSKRGELDNLMAEVTGAANIPGNATVAKWTAFSRAWITMSKLGGMLISSITDLSNYAAELRFGQDKNLLSGMLEGMGSLTRGRAKGERLEVLRSLGVFHESMIGAAVHRFDSPDLLGGKTAAALQTFFKFTGINWWTETLRDAYALSHSSYLASNAGKSWDKLPEALRDMLELYNIDAGKWDVLRVAPLKAAEGQTFMSAEGLATVPRAVLENYIQQVGRTVSDASVQNLRDDLAGALRAMTIDRMHHAVLEPSARTRAFMRRGTQPGTVPGELLRYIGQFKSFPVAMVQMVLGREVYGRGYDTLGDYMRNGRGEMLGLASFIALAVGMGYAAMSTKDLIRGRNPRPVDDPRTWMAAFVQGGGLGIYGDFLFGRYNRMGSTLSGSLIGPAAGVVDTVADLWTRIRMGDDVAAAAFKAALDNTPFMNIFYARAALDYLILYRIQDALNPGFLRRMERRAETEHGQSFWLPPTQFAQ